MKWLSEGDVTEAFTRDARPARRWKWQGNEVEAAVVGQNLGEDYEALRAPIYTAVAFTAALCLSW